MTLVQKALFVVFISSTFLVSDAYAYIDPGIMTIIWQTTILVLASVSAGVGIFYNKYVIIYVCVHLF